MSCDRSVMAMRSASCLVRPSIVPLARKTLTSRRIRCGYAHLPGFPGMVVPGTTFCCRSSSSAISGGRRMVRPPASVNAICIGCTTSQARTASCSRSCGVFLVHGAPHGPANVLTVSQERHRAGERRGCNVLDDNFRSRQRGLPLLNVGGEPLDCRAFTSAEQPDDVIEPAHVLGVVLRHVIEIPHGAHELGEEVPLLARQRRETSAAHGTAGLL